MATSRSDRNRYTHQIARGEKELKVGRGKPIRVANETEKKNPNSLRFVVGHIINFFYGGARNIAVEAMQEVSGRYASDRPNAQVKKMTVDALSTFLNDEDHVEYWHLEVAANSIHLPSGALLLISRVYSLIRDGNSDAALALAGGVRKLADGLQQIAETKTISKDQIENIAEGFAKSSELERTPSLWDAKT
jgi:hypothetical protein